MINALSEKGGVQEGKREKRRREKEEEDEVRTKGVNHTNMG